jgi:hypothetical protein
MLEEIKKYYWKKSKNILIKIRGEEEEMKKKENYRQSQKDMKMYLDMQVEEKKKNLKYERIVDDEQARIWKQDTKNFITQEKELHQIVRIIN